MISRFEDCLKTGCCPHLVPLEHNDASRTVSGFYWTHLAIILNKFTLVKELTLFFRMSKNKSNMSWFTVDNGYSVLHLLRLHNHSHMQLTINKYIAQCEIKGDGRLVENAAYYEAMKMNNLDVLRDGVIIHMAIDSRSYESLDFFLHYHEFTWFAGCTIKLETAIKSGNIYFTFKI